MLKQYDSIFTEQLRSNVSLKVSTLEQVNRVSYLQHQAVFGESAETTKVRVVYDASQKDGKTGTSIIDCLHIYDTKHQSTICQMTSKGVHCNWNIYKSNNVRGNWCQRHAISIFQCNDFPKAIDTFLLFKFNVSDKSFIKIYKVAHSLAIFTTF